MQTLHIARKAQTHLVAGLEELLCAVAADVAGADDADPWRLFIHPPARVLADGSAPQPHQAREWAAAAKAEARAG